MARSQRKGVSFKENMVFGLFVLFFLFFFSFFFKNSFKGVWEVL